MCQRERASQADVGSLGIPDLTLCLEVCLVPNQHDGEVITVLDSEDLREQLAHLVETADEARGVRSSQSLGPSPLCSTTSHLRSPLPVINGKHQQEPVPGAHVLLSHGPKLLLACSVQDCREGDRATVGTRLPLAIPAILPSAPRRPHCPAERGRHPPSRSSCRSLRWWGRSQTRSRTGRVRRGYL